MFSKEETLNSTTDLVSIDFKSFLHLEKLDYQLGTEDKVTYL